MLPESKRWRINGIEDLPDLLGLERLKLIFTDSPDASSPGCPASRHFLEGSISNR